MRRLTSVFLVTCLAGLGVTSAAMAQSSDPAEDTQLIVSEQDGFTITVPASWQQRAGTGSLVEVSDPDTQSRCRAMTWLDGRPVDALAASFADSIRDDPDFEEVSEPRPVDIPAGEAFVIDYSESRSGNAHARYYVQGDGLVGRIMCDGPDRPEDDWLTIAETFEFLNDPDTQGATPQPYDPEDDSRTRLELDLAERLAMQESGRWSVDDPATGEVLSSGPQYVRVPAEGGPEGEPTLVFTPTNSFCYRLLTVVHLQQEESDDIEFTPPTKAEVHGCSDALTGFSEDQALMPMTHLADVVDSADYMAVLESQHEAWTKMGDLLEPGVEVVPAEDEPTTAGKPVTIKGRGSKNTKPFTLAEGDYEVTLKKAKGCDEFTYAVLDHTSGGSAGQGLVDQDGYMYAVEEGRYFWDATADNKCKWAYTLTPLE